MDISQKLVPQVDRLDASVGLVVLVLLLAISGIIVRGDQIGLAVKSFGPLEQASSRTTIQVTFDEPVDLESVKTHFTITPNVAGTWSLVDNHPVFRPTTPLLQGQAYQVIFNAGLIANSGRPLKDDVQWRFTVRQPRITYLGPAGQNVQNLYVIEPDAAGNARQLTHSHDGLLDYDAAPDGNQIVYVEMFLTPDHRTETTTINVLDVATGTSRQLYKCPNVCQAVAWRPDGSAVAFERIDLNSALGATIGLPRIWLYDFATNTAHPLLTDNQILGSAPRWSLDGTRLVFFSHSANGIMIHDFPSNKNITILDNLEQTSRFSPDNEWLYFSKLVTFANGDSGRQGVVADLSTDPPTLRPLTAPAELVSDMEAAWRGDSQALIVARQPANGSINPTPSLYNVDLATGGASLLVPAEGNDQINVAVSPADDALLFERITQGKSSFGTSLWTYGLASKTLKKVADQVTLPAWLP